MPKKIVISFDGTWNTPDTGKDVDGDSSTNVWKLHDAVHPVDDAGIEQRKWYEEGVGTKWYNKIRGGAFGVGLSEKIQLGYKHLARTYEEGDQIYIFGFSRGAYSARSLVGLIRNAGLLRKEHIRRVAAAYSLYRTRDEGADSENAQFFRRSFSREVNIHFLGVWDTVGALGIPVESFDWFNKAYYQFHDTVLSGIVKNAYHAVAVDEHRKSYECTLWDPREKPNQTVEQIWFSGAHANVGGGYADNRLSDISLAWMAGKARKCGLALDETKISPVPAELPPVTDSYRQFLGGAYCKFEPRFYRTLGATPYGQEQVDETVIRRARLDPNYRPKNHVLNNLVGSDQPVGRIRG
ncbi:MAG: DUF2235 domain-containing protein [Syntrophotaleaceae bacterium]